MQDYGIHWFRRDLRVAGNIALKKQFRKHDGRVLGLFCFDKKFLSRPDFSVNRFQFFLKTLTALQTELRELGSDLLVLDIGPQEAYRDLFEKMKSKGIVLPSIVSWGRDYEPFAIARDAAMTEFFQKAGVKTHCERDHLLIEPEELEKSPGQGYQVYSPFAKKWLTIFRTAEIQRRLYQQRRGLEYLQRTETKKVFSLTWPELLAENCPDLLRAYSEENQKKVTVDIPEAGSQAAYKALVDFSEKLDRYGEDRDFPEVRGTSGLSVFFKNGSLTIPQVISHFDLKPYRKKASSRDTYLSELIWREFYYHILFRNPYVEGESFNEKYHGIEWQNDENWFVAWKDGKTGFPIVDAGMRQLKTTGLMHNRVRMIVASFLTKDLLIDWRWGERYFMEALLDGDMAPNNGGWQWAASTGCDPQPYFRIFNPWLQSQKFDPHGDYIRRYIPELASLDTKALHAPILDHPTYPAPIVDHREQKDKALALYKFVPRN